MNLKELKTGHCGVITSVEGDGVLRNRLLDMGLIPKTMVKKIKVAPMGDPMQIYIRGYELTLRNADAEKIELVEVNDK